MSDLITKMLKSVKGDFSIGDYTDNDSLRVLKEKDLVWMSYDKGNIAIQKRYADQCYGKVLCGGLGLGIAVEFLARMESVTEIVVIEKSQDIIDLVWDKLQFNNTDVVCICEDIESYLKRTNTKFDVIYLDTWDGVTKDFYQQMLELKRLALRIADKVLFGEEDTITRWGQGKP